MKRIIRWLGYSAASLLLLLVLYCLSVLVLYPDISSDELASQYAMQDLASTEIEGQTVYYQDTGRGPTLVLVHSHFFTMQMWNDWTRDLSSDFRIIRYDLTSHGLTGPSSRNDYSMNADVALLKGLIEHLNLDDITLVGSSLGGNIAINYTAQHPRNVSALVLQNSGGFRKADSRGGRGEELPGWADYLLYLMPKAAFDFFLSWMIIDESSVTPVLQDMFHYGFRHEGNRFAEMQRIRQFKIGGTAEQLRSITQPVLIQWGEQNPQLPVALVSNFTQSLSQASQVSTIVYPNVGHVLAIENAQQSALDLRDFLNGLKGNNL